MKAIADAYCDFDAPQTMTSKNDTIPDTTIRLSDITRYLKLFSNITQRIR